MRAKSAPSVDAAVGGSTLHRRGYSSCMAKRLSGGKQTHPAEPDARVSRVRHDDANAFIPDPANGPARSEDDLANALAEDFVSAATTGEDVADEDFEQEVPEDMGGPFLESDAGSEFDTQPDESNPPGSTQEPLPTAMGHGPPTPMDLEESEEEEMEASDETEADVQLLKRRRRASLVRPKSRDSSKCAARGRTPSSGELLWRGDLPHVTNCLVAKTKFSARNRRIGQGRKPPAHDNRWHRECTDGARHG